MLSSVFHSFMSSMLMNLSEVQRNFEENETFPSDSDLAHSLERLAVQIDNLRLSLVKGFDVEYSKKYDKI